MKIFTSYYLNHLNYTSNSVFVRNVKDEMISTIKNIIDDNHFINIKKFDFEFDYNNFISSLSKYNPVKNKHIGFDDRKIYNFLYSFNHNKVKNTKIEDTILINNILDVKNEYQTFYNLNAITCINNNFKNIEKAPVSYPVLNFSNLISQIPLDYSFTSIFFIYNFYNYYFDQKLFNNKKTIFAELLNSNTFTKSYLKNQYISYIINNSDSLAEYLAVLVIKNIYSIPEDYSISYKNELKTVIKSFLETNFINFINLSFDKYITANYYQEINDNVFDDLKNQLSFYLISNYHANSNNVFTGGIPYEISTEEHILNEYELLSYTEIFKEYKIKRNEDLLSILHSSSLLESPLDFINSIYYLFDQYYRRISDVNLSTYFKYDLDADIFYVNLTDHFIPVDISAFLNNNDLINIIQDKQILRNNLNKFMSNIILLSFKEINTSIFENLILNIIEITKKNNYKEEEKILTKKENFLFYFKFMLLSEIENINSNMYNDIIQFYIYNVFNIDFNLLEQEEILESYKKILNLDIMKKNYIEHIKGATMCYIYESVLKKFTYE